MTLSWAGVTPYLLNRLHISSVLCVLWLLNTGTWMLCRSMFGDDALSALNIEMVEVARRVGAASKFTGSGGAVVVFCPDGPSQVKLLEDACQKAGFKLEPIQVVPSLLNEVDLQTLSK